MLKLWFSKVNDSFLIFFVYDMCFPTCFHAGVRVGALTLAVRVAGKRVEKMACISCFFIKKASGYAEG